MEYEFFPKQLEAHNAVLSNEFDFILFGGAVRGGKSVWGFCELVLLCEVYPKSRWCVIREDTEKLRTTSIPSFKKLNFRGKLRESPYEYTHPNGSQILFKGENYAKDKELDWLKGFEANGFLFEEINECKSVTLFKAFERTGTWIIPDAKDQPISIIMATCNPTFGWVKELVYDKWKNNTIRDNWKYIQSRVYDNIPFLEANPDYVENQRRNLNRYEFEVFIEGNWDVQLQTGGEFLQSFDLQKHLTHVKFDSTKTIHISIDSNVDPYIAVSLWQLEKDDEKWILYQVGELLHKDPYNTARKAGESTAKWLISNGYSQAIYMYGDRSTKNRNNIDDDKRSFYQIFTDAMRKLGFQIADKFTTFAPPVAASGDFVNAIFDDIIPSASILISESCKASINDYIETKKDKDGTMLKEKEKDPKTGVTFEKNGHLLDTFRYIVTSLFLQEFRQFQNRFKKPDLGGLQFTQKKPKVTF